MYPQARFFIRTALLWLLAAAVVGGLLLVNEAFGLSPAIAALQPTFYHLLMVGWAAQLIFGVALWMFPAFSREQPHGDERLGWLVYVALNLGLLLRVAAEPWLGAAASPLLGWPLVASAVLQVVAAAVFVALIWPRVKGRAGPARRPDAARKG
ncbi:MAG: hypothetical protein U0768_07360 [Anaerolineae bacterium]